MDSVLYEVAVLTRHTDGRAQRDPLLSQTGQASTDHRPEFRPLGAAPPVDSEQTSTEWFNPVECFSGMTDYISAQESLFTTDYSNECSEFEIDGHFNSALNNGKRNKEMVTNYGGSAKVFMGLLTEKLSMVELTDDDFADILKSNQTETSDVESEAYFSASSHQLDDAFGQCSGSLLSASTSGHCSRSSSIGYSSRSSSVTSRSRSPSLDNIACNSKSSDLESLCDASEDNFGDVESLECLSQPFSSKRKKQLRMRKSKQQLGTIFSPGVKMSAPRCSRSSRSGKLFQETDSSDYTSTFSCQSSSESVYPSSSCTESSSGNTTESSLNPLCSPFVPRAMKSAFYYGSESHTDSDCPIEKTNFASIIHDDSGFGTTTNLTMDQSQMNPKNNQTIDESAVLVNSKTKDDILKSQSSDLLATNADLHQTVNPVNMPEFECKVDHGVNEFFSLVGFSVNDLPLSYRNYSVWKTITTTSHRVVKLSVAKPNGSIKQNTDTEVGTEDLFVHYGTGFAHYIGTDYVEIRTHCQVISTEKDAENTIVTFNVLKENGQSIDFHLKGEKENFYSNKYDQSTIFRCKTSTQILDNLHLFVDIPIYREQSNFQDSSYFSDFSQESNSCSSITTSSDVDILSNDLDLIRCEETVKNVIGSLGILDDSTQSEASHQLGSSNFDLNSKNQNGNRQGPSLLPCERGNENGDNYFFNSPSSLNLQYNLSRLTELQNEVDSASPGSPKFLNSSLTLPAFEQIAKEECPSPLRVMEKRKRKTSPGVCPYGDRNESQLQSFPEYNYFSSYAGDVIMASLPAFPAPPSLSPFPEFPQWEMTSLLHAQTHQTDAYNRIYRHVTTVTSNTAGDTDQVKVTRRAKVSSPGKAASQSVGDDWDLDLVNLDKNFNPLPPYRYFEDLLDKVEHEKPHCKCVEYVKKDTNAVIISYPHGGHKVVSFGHFSSHWQVGGDLYDTPTCMGSCGAPVIAVQQDGALAYVSNVVHAGSCMVNHVRSGMGVAHFDNANSFSNQIIEVDKKPKILC